VNGNEFANAVIVSPGGQTIYVTGGSAGKSPRTYFATIAYNAATGAARWVSRYNGSGHFRDSGRSLAVTPDGRTVIVTGSSWGFGNNGDRSTNTDYATIAYNTATGATALLSNTQGGNNTAIGDGALLTNIAGNANTAIGLSAGHSITGDGNICIGGCAHSVAINQTYGDIAGQLDVVYTHRESNGNTAIDVNDLVW